MTISAKIMQDVPNVTPIQSSNMFQSYRLQMTGLLKTILLIMGITWALSIVLIGLVFSMAANERRKELGVIRAIGATRRFVFQSLLLEASFLAVLGGAARDHPGDAVNLFIPKVDQRFPRYPVPPAISRQSDPSGWGWLVPGLVQCQSGCPVTSD